MKKNQKNNPVNTEKNDKLTYRETVNEQAVVLLEAAKTEKYIFSKGAPRREPRILISYGASLKEQSQVTAGYLDKEANGKILIFDPEDHYDTLLKSHFWKAHPNTLNEFFKPAAGNVCILVPVDEKCKLLKKTAALRLVFNLLLRKEKGLTVLDGLERFTKSPKDLTVLSPIYDHFNQRDIVIHSTNLDLYDQTIWYNAHYLRLHSQIKNVGKYTKINFCDRDILLIANELLKFKHGKPDRYLTLDLNQTKIHLTNFPSGYIRKALRSFVFKNPKKIKIVQHGLVVSERNKQKAINKLISSLEEIYFYNCSEKNDKKGWRHLMNNLKDGETVCMTCEVIVKKGMVGVHSESTSHQRKVGALYAKKIKQLDK